MADVAQDAANVVQDEVDADVEAALLTPLKKGWAKRSCQKFLKSHLEEYKTALLVSHEKANSFLDGIVNLWFSKFHWSVPVTQEELLTTLPFPLGADGLEQLTEKQSILKGKSLYNWFNHRSKKTKTLKRSKSAEDPLSILVNRLLGNAGPAKLRTGWEMWGTANYESLKAPFEQAFKDSGKPEKHRATFRNSFKKREFLKLSEEEQKQWADDAVVAHNAAKKVWEAGQEMSPTEAQEAFDVLPNLMGSLIESIGQALKMHVSVFVGGPEPRLGGKINMISVHYGVNKAPSPQIWPFAEKEKFAVVRDAYIEFLSTCYSPDERRQRALPADQSTDNDVPMTTSHTSPEENESTPDTSTLMGVSTHSATDPSDAPKATGKRKRGKEHRKALVAKKRSSSKKGVASKKGAVTKGKKKRRDESDEEESGPESGVEDSDEASSSESSSPSENEDSADERLIQALGTRRSARHTTMDPKRLDTEDLPIDPMVINPMVINPMVIGTLDQAQPSPLIPHQPSPPLASQPLLPPPHVLSKPSPSLVSQLGVTPTPTLLLPDPKWPDWFTRGYELLSAQNLGATFTRAIERYVELEARSSFDIGGIRMGFKKTNRPLQVDWWVGRGRSKAPPITNVASFEASWWTWWKALQPSWRNAAGVDGRLDSSQRTVPAGDEGWSVMDKYGQNAFLTVLATLVWWNSGLLDKGEEGISDPGWTAAVEDVEWVMSQVLGWKATLAPQNTSAAKLIKQTTTAKKRKR